MKEALKLLGGIAAAALLVRLHLKEKKQAGSLRGYGESLLGIRESGKERLEYLDQLRFLAAILVVLVHGMEGAAGKLAESQAASSDSSFPALWYFLTGLSGVGLCCNLLFVMISGALLLPFRQESPGNFYRKRFGKVVIPLVLYYFFYLRRSGLFSMNPESVLSAVKTVISGPMELVPHFWLVYVLVGLYVAVPFLRYLVKELPCQMAAAMAAVVLFGTGIRCGLYLAGTGFGFDSFLFSWTGIFLFGYVLAVLPEGKWERWMIAGGIVSAAVIFWMFCFREDGAAAAANDSPFMILTAGAVFLLFRKGEKKRRLKGKASFGRRLIQIGSRYSYSILLIHWFMLFVVAENHLHLGPDLFGGRFVLAGMMIQVLAALAFSLLFAVIFDQTAVKLALWIWEKIWEGLGRIRAAFQPPIP